jgi:DNA-binding NtrC family response regulator
MPRALLVDDDASTIEALSVIVRRAGFEPVVAGSLAEARQAIEEAPPDLVLLDLQLPDGNGFDLLQRLQDLPAEVVLITGHGTLDAAVDALRSGVADFLTKPLDVDRLRKILGDSLHRYRMKGEIEALRGELRSLGHFGLLLGRSPAMQNLFDLIAKVAPTDASVLVTGETGSGKEVVAQTLHSLSPRKAGPFVAVNCGAIPKDLIASELFGHEKGSFTGASRTRKGCFEQAHGGTLFLDEITEMPLEHQVNLLRVLESKMITRVGGSDAFPVDVRVVAATNRDPAEAVEEGGYREDLHYRLAVFPLHVAPLRERKEDIALLAQHFLGSLNQEGEVERVLSSAAVRKLESYPWPGNVRELKNVIQRAHIMADADILPEHIPLRADVDVAPPDGSVRVRVGSSIAEAEKQLILATLEALGEDKSRAAEVLGISVKTLYNRLNRYKG